MVIIIILVFILILSVLVLIHEAGHFFVAKKLGVKVEEFGFGFPPRVFGKKIGETIYSINLLPVGGFVRLYGEDDAGSGKIGKVKDYSKLKDKELQRAFFVRPVWQRMAIVIAGVVMNFLLALVLISFLFTVQGIGEPTKNVIVTQVLSHSPAEKAGVKANDIVLSINNTKITRQEQVSAMTSHHQNQPLLIHVLRGKTDIQITVIPAYNPQEKRSVIGVGIGQEIHMKKYPWYQAPFAGMKE